MGDEPVKIITFGGARFNANEVASKSTVQRDGKTYYVVNFKTGGKVEYPRQATKNNAAIDIGRGESVHYVGCISDGTVTEYMYNNIDKGKYSDLTAGEGVVGQKADRYTISRFFGLEFTGTQRPDNVTLNGCSNCTVDIAGGNSRSNDQVTIKPDAKFVSKDNEVKMDGKDDVYPLKVTNGELWGDDVVTGAGIYHEGDTRDKLR